MKAEFAAAVDRTLRTATLAVLDGDRRLACVAVRAGEIVDAMERTSLDQRDAEDLLAINALAVKIARLATAATSAAPDRLHPAVRLVSQAARATLTEPSTQSFDDGNLPAENLRRAVHTLPAAHPDHVLLSHYYARIADHAAALEARHNRRANFERRTG